MERLALWDQLPNVLPNAIIAINERVRPSGHLNSDPGDLQIMGLKKRRVAPMLRVVEGNGSQKRVRGNYETIQGYLAHKNPLPP